MKRNVLTQNFVLSQPNSRGELLAQDVDTRQFLAHVERWNRRGGGRGMLDGGHRRRSLSLNWRLLVGARRRPTSGHKLHRVGPRGSCIADGVPKCQRKRGKVESGWTPNKNEKENSCQQAIISYGHS